MAVLESHHFHHQMWSFAMNLFDSKIMQRVVLDDDDEDLEETIAGATGTIRANGRSSRSGSSQGGDYDYEEI